MKKQLAFFAFSAALLFGSAPIDAAPSHTAVKQLMDGYKVERKMVTVGGLADPHSVEFQRGKLFFVLQMLPETASELEQYEGARALIVYRDNVLISYKIKKQ